MGGDEDAFEGGLGGDEDAFEGGLGGDEDAFEGGLGGDEDAFEEGLGGDEDAFEGGLGGDEDAFEEGLGWDEGRVWVGCTQPSLKSIHFSSSHHLTKKNVFVTAKECNCHPILVHTYIPLGSVCVTYVHKLPFLLLLIRNPVM